jgi:NAD(P)-dependent dehydrogenase (short-subunit alcohol dehydrogenase family)
MNRLKDKRGLIAGGTTGIGLETAREFVGDGRLPTETQR